jgi:cell division protein FtsX
MAFAANQAQVFCYVFTTVLVFNNMVNLKIHGRRKAFKQVFFS